MEELGLTSVAFIATVSAIVTTIVARVVVIVLAAVMVIMPMATADIASAI